jgi:hypothetical protein
VLDAELRERVHDRVRRRGAHGVIPPSLPLRIPNGFDGTSLISVESWEKVGAQHRGTKDEPDRSWLERG